MDDSLEKTDSVFPLATVQSSEPRANRFFPRRFVVPLASGGLAGVVGGEGSIESAVGYVFLSCFSC